METALNVFFAVFFAAASLFALIRKKRGASFGLSPFFLRHEKAIAAVLLLVGIGIRIALFWLVPDGLNQDEASVSYDAFADLMYGMDRNGYHNPVYSVAWGSGHSSLYIALTKPWIALFGLNVFTARVVNVLFGCLALFAFYGILRRYHREAAVIGLFLFVICPWHIMECRWGLECNLFPNVFLIALYFLMRGIEKPAWYPVSLFVFGLSLYAYGASYLTVPVFLLLTAIYLLRTKKITVWQCALSAAVFVLTALPIALFMAINVFGLPEMDWGFLSFPRLLSGRYNTTVTVLGGNFVQTVGENLAQFFRILFYQQDGLIWNSIPAFGTVYLFSLPFWLTGLVITVRNAFRKGFHAEMPIVFLLAASLVLAVACRLNINRANFVFVPLLFFLTEGVFFAVSAEKRLSDAILTVYTAAFLLFGGTYFSSYREEIGRAFFDGAGDAIRYACAQTEETVYLTDRINAPYILAMFYEKTDPKRFIETVDYLNPNGECRAVASFDRFVTGIPKETEEGAAYVLDSSEQKRFDAAEFDLQRFGNYAVAIKKDKR